MNVGELSGNIQQAWRSIFLRYVGNGKHVSFASLEEKTRVKKASLHAMAAGEYNPRCIEGMAILACLPQTAADELFRTIGYKTRHLEGETCNHGLMGTVGRTVQHFTAALEDDGRIDHKEEADAEPLVRELHDKSGQWLARRSNNKAVSLEVVGTCNSQDKPA